MQLVPERMGVAVATVDGQPVRQWLPAQYQSLTWTREKSQVSRCDLVVPRSRETQVVQWLHWMTVWDLDAPIEEALLWRGPVTGVERDEVTFTVSARDVGVFTQKTRTPITNRWDGQYPAAIAAELWALMLDMRGYDTRMMVMPDPLGDPFDFDCRRDEKLLNVVVDELVKLGLTWTVSAGTPVLGPMPLEPVAVLSRKHLIEHDLKLVQDGSAMCNDVVIRGADNWDRRSRAMPGGLVLQGLINLDDMFGASNLSKAAGQFLRDHSLVRETVVGRRTKLHPQAPVRLAQLVPSARLGIDLYDRTTVMELDSLQVSVDETGATASIGIDTVNDDPPELDAKFEAGAL